MSFKQKHIIRNFNKAAVSFDAAAFLFSEINSRMIQRLDVISFKPSHILDCGAGVGIGTKLLHAKYPKATIVAADISQQMLFQSKRKQMGKHNHLVCADALQLPFANQSFDFVYANLMLHWCNDINKVFSEWQRVLKPNGLLMFTVFGPDTFKELFNAVKVINPEQAIHQFIDMHDLGDSLLKNQLLDPVMDVEMLQVNYRNPEQLIQELRDVGARNLQLNRKKHLYGKHYLQQLTQQLQAMKTPENKIPLTHEIIYGHAWASGLSANIQKEQSVEVPIFSIRKLFKS